MVVLDVVGEYACFTRPEMKVERVSYDVPTPSAVRAIYEAILWKPEIQWQVRQIEVLRPIQWLDFRRNEVGAVARSRARILIEAVRQQRSARVLRDVRYRFHAEFTVRGEASAALEAKYYAMVMRRAGLGQYYRFPYLGCREFAADVTLVTEATPREPPIAETRDLGWMFYDWCYAGAPPSPRFYRALMEAGVIHVPAWNSEEVRG